MNHYFSEPPINTKFKDDLKAEVLTVYTQTLALRSFWDYFPAKFYIPAFCVLIFAGFIFLNPNPTPNSAELETELSNIFLEISGDIDIQNALAFTENVTD